VLFIDFTKHHLTAMWQYYLSLTQAYFNATMQMQTALRRE